MSPPYAIATKAAELRELFDQARAAPFSAGVEAQTESLIGIRVAGDAYAIRVSEMSGLATDRKVVAVPSPVLGLLGVAAIRGALYPVYSLAVLLGYHSDAEGGRWLALCGADEPFALVLSSFEGYTRIPHEQLYPAEQNGLSRAFVTHVAKTTDAARAIVSIPLIREAIQKRCRESGVPKER